MKWYKIKDKTPRVGEEVLVVNSLFHNCDVAIYKKDDKGIAWWNIGGRACPDVSYDDQWAYIEYPNE